jgi:cyclopropane-fatty-acyl-phospholipid synthase
MAASALSFEAGRLGVNQVLAVRRGAGGSSGLPATRERLLGWAGQTSTGTATA